MPRSNDNWERLVAAVIKKQQLLELFHDHSRSPSILSEDEASDISLSIDDTSLDLSPYDQQKLVRPKFMHPRLMFVSNFESLFELEDLFSASFRVLGKGTFGFSYSAKLDNGETVVVKRLKTVNISEQDFQIYMDVLGTVEHENVAAVRAYYFSQDEKLMIRDHYSTRSVSSLLHGKYGENRVYVNWKLRIRIAIGAARGICHIHRQNRGTWVHGNIKASNIFLNSQQYGFVSDTGLARMILITFPQSSRCYAPEVKSTLNVSQASDVYSFGILLLELLTRKSPDPSLGHEAVDLVKLVSRNERITEVFDNDLLLNPSIREQIARMLQIGISCVAKSPKKRPKMSAVVKMIEDIGMMSIGSEISILHRENRLFASDNVLGNGTLSTSYKVILEDGNVILVKRLKGVNVTDKEFQKHMEVNGRMGHKNVAEIKAYHYSTNEKLLVYKFYNEGSLSARLHLGKSPLDWITRLRIAVGAAKGIAHIHMMNSKKPVHGNISASNILLDEHQNSIICDVGLGKLVSSTKSFVTHNVGYCAPEVTDYREVSQASDVYSFGVVLLEILSAQPPQTTYNGEVMSLVRRTMAVPREKWASQVFDEKIWWYRDVDEEMEKLMEIAMHCVASVPEKRPKMADVVECLEQLDGLKRDKISTIDDLFIG